MAILPTKDNARGSATVRRAMEAGGGCTGLQRMRAEPRGKRYALAVQSLQSLEARRCLCHNVRTPQCTLYRVCRTCEVQKRCYQCGTAKPASAFGAAAWTTHHADRRLCRDCASQVKPCFRCRVAKAEAAFGVTAWKADVQTDVSARRWEAFEGAWTSPSGP